MPALVAVRAGMAAPFSPKSWLVVDNLVPRLHAAGLEVLDGREADLDPEVRLVIAPLAVTLDAAALAGLPGKRGDGVRPAPCRYRVVAWVDVADDDPVPDTIASGVTLVSRGAWSLIAESARSVFETSAAMLRRATWAVSPTHAPNDFATALFRAVS